MICYMILDPSQQANVSCSSTPAPPTRSKLCLMVPTQDQFLIKGLFASCLPFVMWCWADGREARHFSSAVMPGRNCNVTGQFTHRMASFSSSYHSPACWSEFHKTLRYYFYFPPSPYVYPYLHMREFLLSGWPHFLPRQVLASVSFCPVKTRSIWKMSVVQ